MPAIIFRSSLVREAPTLKTSVSGDSSEGTWAQEFITPTESMPHHEREAHGRAQTSSFDEGRTAEQMGRPRSPAFATEALFSPAAVLLAALIAALINWQILRQRTRSDAAALEQKREADGMRSNRRRPPTVVPNGGAEPNGHWTPLTRETRNVTRWG